MKMREREERGKREQAGTGRCERRDGQQETRHDRVMYGMGEERETRENRETRYTRTRWNE